MSLETKTTGTVPVNPVRHVHCGARLLDSAYECAEVPSVRGGADIIVQCWRCKRSDWENSYVGLKLKLPRWAGPIESKPILCSNLNCLHIISRTTLPVVYVENNPDLIFCCQRCKEMTSIQLVGIGRVLTTG